MSIPGLDIFSDDENSEGIEITGFGGTFTIPHTFKKIRTAFDFERVSTISEGSCGVIYKCKDRRTNELYALKKCNLCSLDDGIPSSLLREINLLKTLKHDNIVSVYGTIPEMHLESYYLILDYCPLTLNDLIEKEVNAIYESDVVKCIMKQLFQGLVYIHEGSVIHRNINGENILFTQGGILKITGFHASRHYNKGSMTPVVSELMYRAPELLFQDKTYGLAVDIWSTGCIFAKLLLRKSLFYGNSELEVLRSIFDVLGIPSEALWPGFTELFSQMAEARRIMDEGKPYCDLKHFFRDHPLTVQDLIRDILVYYPVARLKAKDCLKSSYLTDAPDACSLEKLSSILKSALPHEEEMQVEN